MNRTYPLWLKGSIILTGLTLIFVILIYGKFNAIGHILTCKKAKLTPSVA